MEAMLGICIAQLAKTVCLPYCLIFSSTKLEKRAEQVLPGSERCGGGEERGWGQGGEMTQTMYVHMNI
jgi:hypothetical protein